MQNSSPSREGHKRDIASKSTEKHTDTGHALTPIAATPTTKRHRYVTENMYSPYAPQSSRLESPSDSSEPAPRQWGWQSKDKEEAEEEPGILNALFSPVLKYLEGEDEVSNEETESALEREKDPEPCEKESSGKTAKTPLSGKKHGGVEARDQGHTAVAETSDAEKS